MTRLRLWRIQNGYSRAHVAGMVGIGRSTFSFLETGRLAPSRQQIEAFRRVFGDEADRLFEPVPRVELVSNPYRRSG